MNRKIYVSIVIALFSIFVVASLGATACIEAPSGMVSWWPGDGHSLDIIGPNNGDMVNGAGFGAGLVGDAFSFDGVSGFVAGDGAGIDDLQTLTIDFWVYHNSPSPEGVFGTYVHLLFEKANISYNFFTEHALLSFLMTIDGTIYAIDIDNLIHVGEWHHMAGTYDGRFMRLYLDGKEVGNLEIRGRVVDGNGQGFDLGGIQNFDGLLDEVEIYDRALSQSEIEAIYRAGPDGKCKPKYFIDYWHVSHRVYQDGRKNNRLAFALRELATGEYAREDDVASVELYNPRGRRVWLNNLYFTPQLFLNGGYIPWIGQWEFDEEFRHDSVHMADIKSRLRRGTYHLVVTDNDGFKYESDFEFYEKVRLPVISSHSFRTYLDEFNNFIWEWGVPYHIDPTLQTNLRAIILIYDEEDNYVGEVYTRLPTHLGRLFVPADVLEQIKAQGKHFKLQIHLKTTDQNNRSYSNDKPVTLESTFVGW